MGWRDVDCRLSDLNPRIERSALGADRDSAGDTEVFMILARISQPVVLDFLLLWTYGTDTV